MAPDDLGQKPGYVNQREFLSPPLPDIDPEEIDALQIVGNVKANEVGVTLLSTWKSWKDSIQTRYPSVSSVLGTILSPPELTKIIKDVINSAERTINESFALFSHAEADEYAAKAAIDLMQDTVRRNFQAELAKVGARIESQSDPQTGLLTGPVADDHLEKTLHRDRIPAAIFTCDVKGLGDMNTAIGQLLTDKIIKSIFDKFNSGLRSTDLFTIFRRQSGGDEGIGILIGVTSFEQAGVVFKKLLDILDKKIKLSLTTQDASDILRTYIKHKNEINDGVAVGKKVPGAIPILEEAIPQIKKALSHSRRHDSIKISLNVDARFGGLLLSPEDLGQGGAPHARTVLESLEDAAKALEKDHTCPAVVLDVKNDVLAVLSRETMRAAEVEATRQPRTLFPALAGKAEEKNVIPPEWARYSDLDPNTTLDPHSLRRVIKGLTAEASNEASDLGIHALLEQAMALLPEPVPAE